MNFEKLWNYFSVAAGIVGGTLAKMLGGWDALLFSIILLMAVDYLTGVVKGFYLKKLSSEIGFHGICKKAMMLLVIAFSDIMQKTFGESFPFREMVITFFIANEGLSILENAAVMIPIPQQLKDALLQIRDKKSYGENKEETDEQN